MISPALGARAESRGSEEALVLVRSSNLAADGESRVAAMRTGCSCVPPGLREWPGGASRPRSVDALSRC